MFWSHFFKKNQIVFVPKSSIGGFSGFSDLDRRSQGVPRRFFADLLTFSGKKVKIFKKLHPSLSHYAPYPPPVRRTEIVTKKKKNKTLPFLDRYSVKRNENKEKKRESFFVDRSN